MEDHLESLGKFGNKIADTVSAYLDKINWQCFQERAVNWIRECFGEGVAMDSTERSCRFLEEALELAQATGMSRGQAGILLDYVYSRPIGVPKQEVGGVLITLSALCNLHGISMLEAGSYDLENAIENTSKIRIKWGTKPANIRGTKTID